jgi:sensor histidine kinase YesM
MQLHELIFSEKRNYKLIRHFSFWAIWWLYFSLSYLLLQQPVPDSKLLYLTPGAHLPLKTFLLVMLFAITCYPVIYFVFPQVISGKWLNATVYFILICLFLFVASYFLYWNIFSLIDFSFRSSKNNSEGTRFWPPVNLGLMNFIKVIAAAISIKYVKHWWQKQQESQRLEKEKINTELQLLKAQVHPDFLFKTLNNIHIHALSSSPRTTEMLLKLSDLLSYMLYECDRSTVPLAKEVEMMKGYMQLEKIRYRDEPEIQVNIKGDLNGKSIAPFLLLPFIENSFKYCSQMTEHFWINMDIRVERDHFSMKLTNGISEKIANQTSLHTNGLINVQKRLILLYPDKHELKMAMEQEMSIVLLDIYLREIVDAPSKDEEIDLTTTKQEGSFTSVL